MDSPLERAPLSPDDTLHIVGSKWHRFQWVVENYLLARLATDVEAVYLRETERDSASAGDGGSGRSRGKGKGSDKAAKFEAEKQAVEAEAAKGDSDDESLSNMMKAAEGDSLADQPGEFQRDSGDTTGGRGGQPATVIDPADMQVPPPPADAGTQDQEDAEEARPPDVKVLDLVGEAPLAGKVLEFRITELEIRYPRRWRGSLFGSALVERTVRAVIYFRLLDTRDGRVLWADSGRATSTDVVRQKLLAELEVVEEGEGQADSDLGGLGRIVEPVVVSGIVVGLVFLFYSSRT